MNVLLEAVACTVDDARAAEAAGAGRIELVAAISEGGLTPSIGTMREVKRRVQIPVAAMLRPRGGGFTYTEGEFAAMKTDALALLDDGADGLVVGMLSPAGNVDRDRLSELFGHAGNATWVFHRAFDSVGDPLTALEEIISLGFARILTSGRAPSALEGSKQLAELIRATRGRIEIMPGGGVRAENARKIVEATGASSIHLGPFTPKPDPHSGAEHLALDAAEIARVRDILA